MKISFRRINIIEVRTILNHLYLPTHYICNRLPCCSVFTDPSFSERSSFFLTIADARSSTVLQRLTFKMASKARARNSTATALAKKSHKPETELLVKFSATFITGSLSKFLVKSNSSQFASENPMTTTLDKDVTIDIHFPSTNNMYFALNSSYWCRFIALHNGRDPN